MALTKTEICQLLPHTGRMCLLDSVISWDRDEIVCGAVSHRDPENPLRRAGALPAVSGVEYAAQAMGVHGRLSMVGTEKPRAGYLASLRDLVLRVDRLDTVVGELLIRVRRLAGDAGSVMCEFAVGDGSALLLTGRATLVMEVRTSS